MKILCIDIETAPNVAHVWDIWNQNIGISQILDSGEMLCFAACWLDKPKSMQFYSNWQDGHEEMVKAAWTLLDEADVVIHYNGRHFDVPWMQREFVELGLDPPAPFRQLDLYEVVKKQFRFPSNKLDYVAQRLLGVGKTKHQGHELWIRVLAGDAVAQGKMRRYNIQDVRLLIPLYFKLLAWAPRIPSHAGFTGEHVCPACGSDNLRNEGYAYTQVSRYQRYQCRDCGKWSRATKRDGGTDVTETPVN